MAIKHLRAPDAFIWIVAAAVITGGIIRYLMQPTFWLDESFIAASIRAPSFNNIFGRLEYDQHFPRIYLSAIASLRLLFGYEIWSLRLLPFLFFIAATLLVAFLLARRSGSLWPSALLGGLLLLGSGYWLDQAVQLKQYTFDVVLALIPFVIDDAFYSEALAKGRYRIRLLLLALPCLLSYSYPISLIARISGWYLDQGRRRKWRVNVWATLLLLISISLTLVAIWFIDYRFNFISLAVYQAYWSECTLGSRIANGLPGTLKLISNFFWGWHGRMPLVTAGIAPLQMLGVYSILRKWKRAETDGDAVWGSRSLGSLMLIGGLMLASILVSYPICSGRTTLFAQIHFQILAIEGLLFISHHYLSRRSAKIITYAFIAIVAFHSARAYIRFITSEPAENLRPILALMNSHEANTVWVHSCSTAQVKALPEPLPAGKVLLGSEGARPQTGKKTWILWSHMGTDYCQSEFQRIRESAKSWQIVHEGPGRGLALAEF